MSAVHASRAGQSQARRVTCRSWAACVHTRHTFSCCRHVHAPTAQRRGWTCAATTQGVHKPTGPEQRLLNMLACLITPIPAVSSRWRMWLLPPTTSAGCHLQGSYVGHGTDWAVASWVADAGQAAVLHGTSSGWPVMRVMMPGSQRSATQKPTHCNVSTLVLRFMTWNQRHETGTLDSQ